jgi:hypothetical protein
MNCDRSKLDNSSNNSGSGHRRCHMRITIVAECHRADECHDTQLQLLQPLDLRELTVQLDGSAISGAEIADPSGLRSDPAWRLQPASPQLQPARPQH